MIGYSAPVDGLRLAYTRDGSGPPVVLLHGWPGSGRDYDAVGELLAPELNVVVPDLRGFGESDRDPTGAPAAYSAEAQAASVLGLVRELALDRPVLAGFDIGSRVAQAVTRLEPDAARGLVVSPPLPGIGERILTPSAQSEFWYQAFHQLPLADGLIDGDQAAVRAYLAHFWNHWSGPAWTPPADTIDALVELYARPGAFHSSMSWYRAGAGAVAQASAERVPPREQRIDVPTTVLWGEQDPLFPPDWSDRLDDFFADVDLRLLPDVGHFTPLEAAAEFARAIRERSTG
jgi:pimeloyl-ACP methyl ester carboxylesterase